MRDVKESAERFLKENGFVYDNIDINQEVECFIKQMELGLKSDIGLPMMPTYVEGRLHPKRGEKAIAVDVGGTNLRVALLQLNGTNTEVVQLTKAPILGKRQPVSFELFIDDLVDKIEPYLTESKTICFSFAHEINHTSDMDGVATFMSKEVSINGIKEKLLAKSLRTAVKKRTGDDVKIILINDTVGVAGSMLQLGDKYQNFFGIVMGTGVNACYIEQCKQIKKIKDSTTVTMFINIESGSYIPSVVSSFDLELDATTRRPNTAKLEKMSSGEYLGKLFNIMIKKACKENMFSAESAKRLTKSEMFGTKELSAFYKDQNSGKYSIMCINNKDRALLYYFARCIIIRAAMLISIKIIAISKKIHRPINKPICVIVEGATYYGLKGFKDMVEQNIELQSEGMDIELYNVKDAALVGIGNIGLAFV